MTRWYAVVAGVAVACLVETTLFLGGGVLTVAGGLFGSVVAGYLAGDEPTNGAWHGLLAALAWGIVLMPGAVLLAVVESGGVLVPFDALLPLFRTPGEVTTALVLGVTLPNAGAGAAGSLLRRHVDPERPAAAAAPRDAPANDAADGASDARGTPAESEA